MFDQASGGDASTPSHVLCRGIEPLDANAGLLRVNGPAGLGEGAGERMAASDDVMTGVTDATSEADPAGGEAGAAGTVGVAGPAQAAMSRAARMTSRNGRPPGEATTPWTTEESWRAALKHATARVDPASQSRAGRQGIGAHTSCRSVPSACARVAPHVAPHC